MNKHLSIVILSVFILLNINTKAQFNALVDAVQLPDCNCFQLTDTITSQKGVIWRTEELDLLNSFDVTIQVFLGYKYYNTPVTETRWKGADGMAFVIHNANNTIGTVGGGSMGYQGISPSVAVTIDTFENDGPPHNDIVQDHISLHKNGGYYHGDADELVAALPALASGDNIEDSVFHDLRIVWDVATSPPTMSVYFDDESKFNYQGDIVTDVFGGDPIVYWGVTASTGGIFNLQKFCYEFEPTNEVLQNDIACIGDTAHFLDNSTNFFGIDNISWESYDGTIKSGDSVAFVFDTAGVIPVYVTVTDDIGCASIDTLQVRIHSPYLEATVTNDSICEGTQVDFNTTLTPGIAAPCEYTLFNFDFFGANWTGANVNVYVDGFIKYIAGSPGTYPLLLNNGDVVALEYIDNAASDFSNTYFFDDNNGVELFGDGVQVDASTASPGIQYTTTVTCPQNTTNYTYVWEPSSEFTNSSLENQQIIPVTTTDYSVTVTDNVTGCIVYDTLGVYVEKQLIVGLGRDSTLCVNELAFNKQVLITSPFDLGGVWYNSSSVAVSEIFNPAADASDDYTYVIDHEFCNDASTTITLTIEGTKSAGISSDTTICISEVDIDLVDVLDGIPDIGGAWKDASGSAISSTYNLSVSDVYTANYTIVDAVCGDVTSNVTVTIDQLPEAGIGTSNTLCVNDNSFDRNEMLTGFFDIGGYWLNENSDLVTDLFAPVSDTGGVFTYLVNGGTCVDDNAAITITMQASLSAGISSDSMLCISEATIDLMSVLDGSPDAGGTWTDFVGVSISNNYDLSSETEYIASYTLSDLVCGDIVSNVTVTAEQLPSSGFGSDLDICSSADSVEYMSLLSGSYTLGAWFNQSGDTLRDYFNASIDSNGMFTYKVLGDLCPGESSTSISINVETEPNIGSSGDTMLCKYDISTNMFDLIVGNPDSGGAWSNSLNQAVTETFDPKNDEEGVFTYTISNAICGNYSSNVNVRVSQIQNSAWSEVGVSCNGGENGAIEQTIKGGISPYIYLWGNGSTTSGINNQPVGEYNVSVSDSIGCVFNSVITISQPLQLAYLVTVNNTHCDFQCDGSIEVEVSGGVSPYTYEWSHGGVSNFLCEGHFKVSITDALNCILVSDAITLLSEDSLQANFTFDIQEEDPFQVIFVDSTNGVPVMFDWDFSDGTNSIEDSLLTNYSDSGTYNVKLAVENIHGCLDTVSQYVTIVNPLAVLVVPTAISPNGDGFNDSWEVENIQFYDMQSVWIYNRWGGLVYQSDNYGNDWDGKFEAEYLPEGVYYFILDLGLEEKINGSIDIIK